MNRKVAAWLVHLYTAIGGVIGIFALILATEGRIREAFLLLVITTLIDATDGILARLVRVKEVLPWFDGAMIDNVIDFFTYVWVPVFILYEINVLPHPAWLILPIIAALYAYGQVNMKTDDDYFLGFPSYWNIIALYLFWLRPSADLAVLVLTVAALLTFIPTRYLYPSKNRIFWKVSWALGGVWMLLALYLLLQESLDLNLVTISLFYPVYYMVMSFYIEWKHRRGTLESPVSQVMQSS